MQPRGNLQSIKKHKTPYGLLQTIWYIPRYASLHPCQELVQAGIKRHNQGVKTLLAAKGYLQSFKKPEETIQSLKEGPILFLKNCSSLPTTMLVTSSGGNIHLACMIYTYHPILLGKLISWQLVGCQQNLTICGRWSFCCQPKNCQGFVGTIH